MTLLAPLPRRSSPAKYQRRIVANQGRDLARLIPPFRRNLERAFDDLGDRAAKAYRQVVRRRAMRQVDPTDAPFVDAIEQSLDYGDWEQAQFEPMYRAQYARTLHATTTTIGLAMGLGVNIPDEVGRAIVRNGGRRIGLVDYQGQTRTALFHALADGRTDGLAREALAARIKSQVAAGPYRTPEIRAQVIARTETAHAQRVSALTTYSRMDTVTGVLAFDGGMGATDADCEERSGRVFSLHDADIETGFEHPNGTLTWAPHAERAPMPASAPPGPAPGTGPPVHQFVRDRQLPSYNAGRRQDYIDRLRAEADRLNGDSPTTWTTAHDIAERQARYRVAASRLEDLRATVARDLGIGVDDLDAFLADAFSPDNVQHYVAIRADNLGRMIKDNHLKNSLEAGRATFKTHGLDRWERYEKHIFNMTDDALATPEALPNYGFLSNKAQVDTKGILSNIYGENYIRMKPQVRARTTITADDSLNGNQRGISPINPATPLNDVGDDLFTSYAGDIFNYYPEETAAALREYAETKDLRLLLRANGNRTAYVEAQTFGKVTLDDIESIMVESIKVQKRTKAALKKAGYPDIEVVSSGHHRQLWGILRGELDTMDNLSPVDIDNLGEVYINKLFSNSAVRWLKPDSDLIAGVKTGPLRETVERTSTIAAENITLADKRALLRAWHREVELQDAGGLEKVMWKDYKKTKAGWTDDVLEKRLLDDYPDPEADIGTVWPPTGS